MKLYFSQIRETNLSVFMERIIQAELLLRESLGSADRPSIQGYEEV